MLPRQMHCAWLHAHSCRMPARVLIAMEPSVPTSSKRTGKSSEKTRPSLTSARLCHSFMGPGVDGTRTDTVSEVPLSGAAAAAAVRAGRRWRDILEKTEPGVRPEVEDDSARAARARHAARGSSAGAAPAGRVCIGSDVRAVTAPRVRVGRCVPVELRRGGMDVSLGCSEVGMLGSASARVDKNQHWSGKRAAHVLSECPRGSHVAQPNGGSQHYNRLLFAHSVPGVPVCLLEFVPPVDSRFSSLLSSGFIGWGRLSRHTNR